MSAHGVYTRRPANVHNADAGNVGLCSPRSRAHDIHLFAAQIEGVQERAVWGLLARRYCGCGAIGFGAIELEMADLDECTA